MWEEQTPSTHTHACTQHSLCATAAAATAPVAAPIAASASASAAVTAKVRVQWLLAAVLFIIRRRGTGTDTDTGIGGIKHNSDTSDWRRSHGREFVPR